MRNLCFCLWSFGQLNERRSLLIKLPTGPCVGCRLQEELGEGLRLEFFGVRLRFRSRLYLKVMGSTHFK